jgi:hypothetical protein
MWKQMMSWRAKAHINVEQGRPISTAMDSYDSSGSSKNNVPFSISSSRGVTSSATNAASEVFGNDVHLRAGENVLIKASVIATENDLSLQAEQGDALRLNFTLKKPLTYFIISYTITRLYF